MTEKNKNVIPDDLELLSLHRFLSKKSVHDVEIAAEYDECGTVGWWSNYWTDWDELRSEESYDHWFKGDVSESRKI